jgi:hypothetical protein
VQLLPDEPQLAKPFIPKRLNMASLSIRQSSASSLQPTFLWKTAS